MLFAKKIKKTYAWWLYPLFILYIIGQILATTYAQEPLNYQEIAQFQMDSDISSFSWSPDSTQLALGMCGVDEVRILDISSGDYDVVPTQRGCAEIDWDKVGGLLAIADNSWQCNDNQILIWEPRSRQVLHTIETTGCIQSIQWSREGTQLLIYLRWQGHWSIQIWNIETEQSETMLASNGEQEIELVALSSDGTTLALANNHFEEEDTLPSIDVIDLASGEIVQQLINEETRSLGLRDLLIWSPQGDILAARMTDAGSRGFVVFWDLASGEIVSRSHSSAIAWHPIEDYVAVNVVPDDAGEGAYKDIFIREIGGDVLATLEGHDDQVTRLAWNPEGTLLASTSLDRTIRIWSQ